MTISDYRVYSTTLGDFVEGAGGVSVTIPFAEVVPALQKGVADCGITGTMPFVVTMFVMISLLVLFPELALWLPELFY